MVQRERFSEPTTRARMIKITDQRGQAVVEYSLMLIMLSVILIVTMTFMDHTIRNVVCNITNQLSPIGIGLGGR